MYKKFRRQKLVRKIHKNILIDLGDLETNFFITTEIIITIICENLAWVLPSGLKTFTVSQSIYCSKHLLRLTSTNVSLKYLTCKTHNTSIKNQTRPWSIFYI